VLYGRSSGLRRSLVGPVAAMPLAWTLRSGLSAGSSPMSLRGLGLGPRTLMGQPNEGEPERLLRPKSDAFTAVNTPG
jgi:hypothetical protein